MQDQQRQSSPPVSWPVSYGSMPTPYWPALPAVPQVAPFPALPYQVPVQPVQPLLAPQPEPFPPPFPGYQPMPGAPPGYAPYYLTPAVSAQPAPEEKKGKQSQGQDNQSQPTTPGMMPMAPYSVPATGWAMGAPMDLRSIAQWQWGLPYASMPAMTNGLSLPPSISLTAWRPAPPTAFLVPSPDTPPSGRKDNAGGSGAGNPQQQLFSQLSDVLQDLQQTIGQARKVTCQLQSAMQSLPGGSQGQNGTGKQNGGPGGAGGGQQAHGNQGGSQNANGSSKQDPSGQQESGRQTRSPKRLLQRWSEGS